MRSIRDTQVCVVGGAGFLGSHCVDELINNRNCQVLVLDNLIAGRREFVHPKAKFEHCDITASEIRLCNLFEWNKIKYVFNFAAHPYIPVSFERPLHVFETNATGALKVINSAQEAGVEGILQISSAEIYGEGQASDNVNEEGHCVSSIDENAPVSPHSSYGVAKAAIDSLVQVRWKEAQTPCIALRQFNCVGERDILHPYIVPEIIKQLISPDLCHYTRGEEVKPILRLGNNSFRDFLYAGDQAKMAIELLEKGELGEVYNLGSESGVNIYDLAQIISKLIGHKAGVMVKPDPDRIRPWEIWHLLSCNEKIYRVIEARPTVSLEEALRRTIKWFQDNGSKWGWEK